MPRFVMESDFSSPPLPVKEMLPRNRPHRLERSLSRRGPLSCLSPDGRSVYSLNVSDGNMLSIDAHNLPLEGYTEETVEREFPALIRTRLPPAVCSALAVDAPVELLCTAGDATCRPPKDTDYSGRPQQFLLPLLCLYTRHSVFVIQLAFQCPFLKEEIVAGQLLSATEPFESHLAGESSSTTIVRVRPAPQRRMGYATHCPPGSMAMLTHDATVNEYALVLYHGKHENRSNGWISSPLRFGMEQLVEEQANTITDFSFAQSNGVSLLTTMSVHLLRASGEVLGASPILFDGAVVDKAVVCASLDYLHHVIESDENDVRVRQCVAARQFVWDAFGRADTMGNYVTARTTVGVTTESSLCWPVQVQGPVIVAPLMEPDEEWNRALAMEPFYARDLVGIVIGREHSAVDFCVIPSTALLPRFIYMAERDREMVDNFVSQLGVVVERVLVVDSDTAPPRESGWTMLVRDPVENNMIHHASNQGVLSITTNAMSVFSSNIRGEALETGETDFQLPTKRNGAIRSRAWSSVDVSAADGRISLNGAVVSGDAHLGHTLVALLSDGSVCAINLTESRYWHESESLFHISAEENSRDQSAADEALRAMEATPPLHELIEPLIEEVRSGLDGMAKIVGANTAPRDINPSTLAIAVSVKERCDKEIVLPLKELNQITASRLVELKEMYKSQISQVAALKESVKLLQDRMKATAESLDVAESNATLLSQRSSALLQSSQDLRPTTTQAEHEYWQLLKRVRAKCEKWEVIIGELQQASSFVCNAMKEGRATVDFDLEPNEYENCRALLRGEEQDLRASGESVGQTKSFIKAMASATGICIGNDGTSD